MNMKKLWIAAAVVVAVTSSAAGVYAGHKVSMGAPVVMTGGAFGGMGDARASADTMSQVICSVSITLSTNWMGAWCQICDPAGNCRICTSSLPGAIQTVAAVRDSSWVSMNFDANGNCTQLQVESGSSLLPITP